MKPGKALLLGDLAIGDLTIDVGEPEQWFPLEAVPGPRLHHRSSRARRCATARRSAPRASPARGRSSASSRSPREARSYSDTVHVAAARTIEVKQRKGGLRIKQESDVELWCVEGVGIVAASYAFRFYEDGAARGPGGRLRQLAALGHGGRRGGELAPLV